MKVLRFNEAGLDCNFEVHGNTVEEVLKKAIRSCPERARSGSDGRFACHLAIADPRGVAAQQRASGLLASGYKTNKSPSSPPSYKGRMTRGFLFSSTCHFFP